ncbi:MAG: isoaspartyl peptidase/L-asparaginase [Xanthomonadales bacterium]|nr:isoaspartyl peptidase/L-asparaginase [Xanthomonadales bacterium]
MRPALAIHGGAGIRDAAELSPERIRVAVAALAAILEDGYARLRAGASALEAVEEAVAALEDCPLFNAGRGSVLNADGEIEMDAAIACGRSRRFGAVAAVRGLRNPVRAARRVLEDGRHVLLVGEGARRFALARGAEPAAEDWLRLPERVEQLALARSAGLCGIDFDERRGSGSVAGCDTVGAVALDRAGHLAAATSTGGLTGKLPGRVGDSPLPGCGTFARDGWVAVSLTGLGEGFMRAVSAHALYARMRFLGEPLAVAAQGGAGRAPRAWRRGRPDRDRRQPARSPCPSPPPGCTGPASGPMAPAGSGCSPPRSSRRAERLQRRSRMSRMASSTSQPTRAPTTPRTIVKRPEKKPCSELKRIARYIMVSPMITASVTSR